MNFYHPEKKAIVSIVLSIAIFTAAIIYVGQKNFWFSKVVKYTTLIGDAQGLRKGSTVSLKGIRVGEITKLFVNEEEKIEVHFLVFATMAKRIRSGTKAVIVRSFLIGEKRIDLQLGPKDNAMIEEGGVLEGIDSRELSDIISGKGLTPMIKRMEKVGNNLESLITKVQPTLSNVNEAAKSISASLEIAQIMKRDFLDNKLAKKTLQDTRSFLKPFKNKASTIEDLIESAHKLASEIGENPNLTKDVMQTLKEAIITLKAIQRTWMLKSHVEDVKKSDDE
ncbi:hypothetical protein A9Q84_00565 [Halobacteriovorax marinus]|uniref:Mce/MlaD domain-containing protein n=1 Tax=Halobacteriovorax marinus TaxID=97084 RepID=A0A1Y5FH73_9BACT|nr:hypothetical protein A9Q84_00565 [Halobacteriovorax marinus]